MTAALKMFAERGYEGTSNKAIAEAAGLSTPALIYHYFPSKTDLLRAVAERFSPPAQFEQEGTKLFSLPPRIALEQIAKLYLETFSSATSQSLVRVLLGEALKNEEFAKAFGQVGPLRLIGVMATYFEQLMNDNVIRRTDPMIAARQFFGPLFAVCMIPIVFGSHAVPPFDVDVLAKESVRNYLEGMEVKGS